MSSFFERYLPLLVVGLAVAYLAAVMVPHGDAPEAEQLQQFGKLPVQMGGRIQPLDSLARNSLMIMSGRQSFRDDEGKSQPAIRWLLDVMSARAVINSHMAEVSRIRIDSPELIKSLGLPPATNNTYDIGEFEVPPHQDRVRRLAEAAMSADKLEPSQRSEGDRQALSVARKVVQYRSLREQRPEVNGICGKYPVFRIENDQLLTTLGLSQRTGLRYSIEEFRGRMGRIDDASKRARDKDGKDRDAYDIKVLDLRQHLELYLELAYQLKPQAVPSEKANSGWKSLSELRGETDEPAGGLFERMLLAHAEKKPEEFNAALSEYNEYLAENRPDDARHAKVEAFFNHGEPFYQCMVLYLVVFLLAFVGFAFRYDPLVRSAFWLAALTLVVHSLALIARMYISGRPPVTNLYSSAVFIGWGCVLLALMLEVVYQNGIGNVVGSVMGFSTVFIAHHLLAAGGDTLEMLQAVLDTNFWLATHVVCVTLGYTATFVAGGLGILFVVLGVCTPRLDRELHQSLAQMIYGVVCFATLLSFVGTVLGGIWADQSWGRFWGWDPKENGALLIVIWNALILHARWAGMVKQRGMAVLTIVGNMVTLWSWFGTNQLSVGLHAYGFNNTLAATLTIVWGVHLVLIGVGMLPLKWWWSFATPPQDPTSKRKRRPEPQPV